MIRCVECMATPGSTFEAARDKSSIGSGPLAATVASARFTSKIKVLSEAGER